MDAQAGLRLCYSQHPEDRFSRVEAHKLLHSVSFILLRLFSFSEANVDNMSKIPSLAFPLIIPVKFGGNPPTRIRNTEKVNTSRAATLIMLVKFG